MTDPIGTAQELIVYQMADAMWRCEGFPGELCHASEETQERLKHMALTALQSDALQSRIAEVAELREALRAIDETAFVAVTSTSAETKAVAAESIHDIASAALSLHRRPT
jgi:hypothetical protein